MDNKSISVLKGLTIDIIQNSNLDFLPINLSSAPILYTIYTKHIRVHPLNPNWINRDRFVLSSSKASALLYAQLFLSGYQIGIDDLKNYGKLDSKTPITPQISTIGVDVSTGLPGEGFATSVGIALAEKIYEQKYNKKPKNKFDKKVKPLFNYYTYVLLSYEDLMQGVSYEAASFAGDLKLEKLIAFYDYNKSELECLNKNFNESISSRFSSMGWDVHIVKDGSSVSQINKEIVKAKKSNLPSLIIVNTKIEEASSLSDKNKIYNGKLTNDDYQQLKKVLNAEGLPFTVSKEPAENIRNQLVQRGTREYELYESIYNEYKGSMNQSEILEVENILFNNLMVDLTKVNININNEQKELLRDSNEKVINVISNNLYNFVGGTSDLTKSTKTYLEGKENITKDNFLGKNILYGSRENAMGAISNGLALSGFRPFASTFLTFSDYMDTSIRMSALMNLPVTYIFTHDSITVGYVGPIYQPIEQLASFRAMPNINVYRPADIKEIMGSWQCIMQDKTPSIISLAKTEVKPQNGTNMLSVAKGAYIVSGNEDDRIDAVIIATGAEVQLANSIRERLKHEGKEIRVVSMPCMEKYYEQSEGYKMSLFPENAKIFVLEYGSSFGWEKFVESSDYLFTIDSFGKSASKEDVVKYCEVDIETIIERIKSLI